MWGQERRPDGRKDQAAACRQINPSSQANHLALASSLSPQSSLRDPCILCVDLMSTAPTEPFPSELMDLSRADQDGLAERFRDLAV